MMCAECRFKSTNCGGRDSTGGQRVPCCDSARKEGMNILRRVGLHRHQCFRMDRAAWVMDLPSLSGSIGKERLCIDYVV